MTPQPPTFSLAILLTLLVMLGASVLTFALLVRRWTTQRQWISLAEWARQRGMRFRPVTDQPLPPALAGALQQHAPRLALHLGDERITIMQLQTGASMGTAAGIGRWNLLLRKVPHRRTHIAGLRPTHAAASLLDLLGLEPYPSLAMGHRFIVLSSSSLAARALANSAARTLLPADLGLLVCDEHILIDFSSRPFDPIELDRMIALSEQLALMSA
ncbi:MAG TPA: hypothetical protein VNL70_04670 [Tepidisphaeraceae bacterium]|nr:hypothetical protein [Tepidisphaeraceae bacterium]